MGIFSTEIYTRAKGARLTDFGLPNTQAYFSRRGRFHFCRCLFIYLFFCLHVEEEEGRAG